MSQNSSSHSHSRKTQQSADSYFCALLFQSRLVSTHLLHGQITAAVFCVLHDFVTVVFIAFSNQTRQLKFYQSCILVIVAPLIINVCDFISNRKFDRLFTHFVGVFSFIFHPNPGKLKFFIFFPQEPEDLWKMMFLFTAAMNVIFCAIYIIWGSSEVQPWNCVTKKATEENHKKMTWQELVTKEKMINYT